MGDLRSRVWSFIRHAPCLTRRRRARGRGDLSGRALAAPGEGFRTALRQLAAAAADRRRGRPGENHPGRNAAAAGLDGGPGQAHPDPGAQGRAQAVADRTAGEIQPQLADLRRPQADLAPLSGAGRTPRARGGPRRLAQGAGGHRVEPPDAPRRPGRGAVWKPA